MARTLYYITGSSSDWSDSSNWSLTSNGAGGESPPTSIDDVIFDTHSPSMTADVDINCKSLTIGVVSGATVMDFNDHGVTVEGNLAISNPTLYLGSGTIIANNSIAGSSSFNAMILHAETSTIYCKKTTAFSGGTNTFHNLKLADTGTTLLIDAVSGGQAQTWNWTGVLTFNGGIVKQNYATDTMHNYTGSTGGQIFEWVAGSDIQRNSTGYFSINFNPSATATIELPEITGTTMAWKINITTITSNVTVQQLGHFQATSIVSIPGSSNIVVWESDGYDITLTALLQTDSGVSPNYDSLIDLTSSTGARFTTLTCNELSMGGFWTLIRGTSDIYITDDGRILIFSHYTKGSGLLSMSSGLQGDTKGYTLFDVNPGRMEIRAGATNYLQFSSFGTTYEIDELTVYGKLDLQNKNLIVGSLITDSTADIKGFTGNTITAEEVSIDPAGTYLFSTAAWKIGLVGSPTTSDLGNTTIASLEIMDNAGEVTLSDYFTVSGELKAYPGQSIVLAPATSSPFSFGSLNMEGTIGEHIAMTGDGGVAEIAVTIAIENVSYVDPTNVDASAGYAITSTGGTGTGDTTNWTFDAGSSSSSSSSCSCSSSSCSCSSSSCSCSYSSSSSCSCSSSSCSCSCSSSSSCSCSCSSSSSCSCSCSSSSSCSCSCSSSSSCSCSSSSSCSCSCSSSSSSISGSSFTALEHVQATAASETTIKFIPESELHNFLYNPKKTESRSIVNRGFLLDDDDFDIMRKLASDNINYTTLGTIKYPGIVNRVDT